MRNAPVLALCFMILLSSCTTAQKETAPAQTGPPAITESYITRWDQNDNIDSPAVWHGPGNRHWLIATAKTSDALVVYNAVDGHELHRVGGPGNGPGQFERPNGIAVVDDHVLVVERDNHRVQVLKLPELTSIGSFGSESLVRPYGLYAESSGNTWTVFVTDNYETADERIPDPGALGERVKKFTVSLTNDRLESTLDISFGATTGKGVLYVVESIWGDPVSRRLCIADEHETERCVKVYTYDGEFTGLTAASGLIENECEGIVLYERGNGGYWVVTDQGRQSNVFYVLDRDSFSLLGSFTGSHTANTDGIALSNSPLGPFSSGAFFAVHDDGGVSAFSWQTIADSLGLALSH